MYRLFFVTLTSLFVLAACGGGGGLSVAPVEGTDVASNDGLNQQNKGKTTPPPPEIEDNNGKGIGGDKQPEPSEPPTTELADTMKKKQRVSGLYSVVRYSITAQAGFVPEPVQPEFSLGESPPKCDFAGAIRTEECFEIVFNACQDDPFGALCEERYFGDIRDLNCLIDSNADPSCATRIRRVCTDEFPFDSGCAATDTDVQTARKNACLANSNVNAACAELIKETEVAIIIQPDICDPTNPYGNIFDKTCDNIKEIDIDREIACVLDNNADPSCAERLKNVMILPDPEGEKIVEEVVIEPQTVDFTDWQTIFGETPPPTRALAGIGNSAGFQTPVAGVLDSTGLSNVRGSTLTLKTDNTANNNSNLLADRSGIVYQTGTVDAVGEVIYLVGILDGTDLGAPLAPAPAQQNGRHSVATWTGQLEAMLAQGRIVGEAIRVEVDFTDENFKTFAPFDAKTAFGISGQWDNRGAVRGRARVFSNLGSDAPINLDGLSSDTPVGAFFASPASDAVEDSPEHVGPLRGLIGQGGLVAAFISNANVGEDNVFAGGLVAAPAGGEIGSDVCALNPFAAVCGDEYEGNRLAACKADITADASCNDKITGFCVSGYFDSVCTGREGVAGRRLSACKSNPAVDLSCGGTLTTFCDNNLFDGFCTGRSGVAGKRLAACKANPAVDLSCAEILPPVVVVVEVDEVTTDVWAEALGDVVADDASDLQRGSNGFVKNSVGLNPARPNFEVITFEGLSTTIGGTGGVAIQAWGSISPNGRISNNDQYIGLLPNTSVGAPLAQTAGKADWHGYIKIPEDIIYQEFVLEVDFEHQKIEAFVDNLYVQNPANRNVFYITGDFDNKGIISGHAQWFATAQIEEGTSPTVNEDDSVLTGIIGQRGAVGGFIDTSGSSFVSGGFVATPEREVDTSSVDYADWITNFGYDAPPISAVNPNNQVGAGFQIAVGGVLDKSGLTDVSANTLTIKAPNIAGNNSDLLADRSGVAYHAGRLGTGQVLFIAGVLDGTDLGAPLAHAPAVDGQDVTAVWDGQIELLKDIDAFVAESVAVNVNFTKRIFDVDHNPNTIDYIQVDAGWDNRGVIDGVVLTDLLGGRGRAQGLAVLRGLIGQGGLVGAFATDQITRKYVRTINGVTRIAPSRDYVGGLVAAPSGGEISSGVCSHNPFAGVCGDEYAEARLAACQSDPNVDPSCTDTTVDVCDNNPFDGLCGDEYAGDRLAACKANPAVDLSCGGILTGFCDNNLFDGVCTGREGVAGKRLAACKANPSVDPSCGGTLTTFCDNNLFDGVCTGREGVAGKRLAACKANPAVDLSCGGTLTTFCDNNLFDGFCTGRSGVAGRRLAACKANPSVDLSCGGTLTTFCDNNLFDGVCTGREGVASKRLTACKANPGADLSCGGILTGFCVTGYFDSVCTGRAGVAGRRLSACKANPSVDPSCGGTITAFCHDTNAPANLFDTACDNEEDVAANRLAACTANRSVHSSCATILPPVEPPVVVTEVTTDVWATVLANQIGDPAVRDASDINKFVTGSGGLNPALSNFEIITLDGLSSQEGGTGGVAIQARNTLRNGRGDRATHFAGLLPDTSVGAPLAQTAGTADWHGHIKIPDRRIAKDFVLNIDFEQQKIAAIVDSQSPFSETYATPEQRYTHIDGGFNNIGIISGSVGFGSASERNTNGDTATLSGIIGQRGAAAAFIAHQGFKSISGGFVATPARQVDSSSVDFADWQASFGYDAPPTIAVEVRGTNSDSDSFQSPVGGVLDTAGLLRNVIGNTLTIKTDNTANNNSDLLADRSGVAYQAGQPAGRIDGRPPAIFTAGVLDGTDLGAPLADAPAVDGVDVIATWNGQLEFLDGFYFIAEPATVNLNFTKKTLDTGFFLNTIDSIAATAVWDNRGVVTGGIEFLTPFIDGGSKYIGSSVGVLRGLIGQGGLVAAFANYHGIGGFVGGLVATPAGGEIGSGVCGLNPFAGVCGDEYEERRKSACLADSTADPACTRILADFCVGNYFEAVCTGRDGVASRRLNACKADLTVDPSCNDTITAFCVDNYFDSVCTGRAGIADKRVAACELNASVDPSCPIIAPPLTEVTAEHWAMTLGNKIGDPDVRDPLRVNKFVKDSGGLNPALANFEVVSIDGLSATEGGVGGVAIAGRYAQRHASFNDSAEQYAGLLPGTSVGAPLTQSTSAANWDGYIKITNFDTYKDFVLQVDFGQQKVAAVVERGYVAYRTSLGRYVHIDGNFNDKGIISGHVGVGRSNIKGSDASDARAVLTGIIGADGAVGAFIGSRADHGIRGGFVATPDWQADTSNVTFADWQGDFGYVAPPTAVFSDASNRITAGFQSPVDGVLDTTGLSDVTGNTLTIKAAGIANNNSDLLADRSGVAYQSGTINGTDRVIYTAGVLDGTDLGAPLPEPPVVDYSNLGRSIEEHLQDKNIRATWAGRMELVREGGNFVAEDVLVNVAFVSKTFGRHDRGKLSFSGGWDNRGVIHGTARHKFEGHTSYAPLRGLIGQGGLVVAFSGGKIDEDWGLDFAGGLVAAPGGATVSPVVAPLPPAPARVTTAQWLDSFDSPLPTSSGRTPAHIFMKLSAETSLTGNGVSPWERAPQVKTVSLAHDPNNIHYGEFLSGDAADGVAFFQGVVRSQGGRVYHHAGLFAGTDLGAPLTQRSGVFYWPALYREVNDAKEFMLKIDFNNNTRGVGTIDAFFHTFADRHNEITGYFDRAGVIRGTMIGGAYENGLRDRYLFGGDHEIRGLIGEEGVVAAFVSANGGGGFVATPHLQPGVTTASWSLHDAVFPEGLAPKISHINHYARYLRGFEIGHATRAYSNFATSPDYAEHTYTEIALDLDGPNFAGAVRDANLRNGMFAYSVTYGFGILAGQTSYFTGISSGADLGAALTQTNATAQWRGRLAVLNPAHPPRDFTLDIVFGSGGAGSVEAFVQGAGTHYYHLTGDFNSHGAIVGTAKSGTFTDGDKAQPADVIDGVLHGLIGTEGAIGIFGGKGAAADSVYVGGFVAAPSE